MLLYRYNCIIMKAATYDAKAIEGFLRRQKIATIEDLKRVLGTDVRITVFRKLQELSYRTSYSHRGKFYTLDEVAEFGPKGLWTCKSVWFSRFGTLLDTIVELVAHSSSGYQADELEEALHVTVNQPLLTLIERKLLVREKVSGLYVYFSRDPRIHNKQFAQREGGGGPDLLVPSQAQISGELKAAILLFFCLLDERQRRLYAGIESLKLGHGGDQRMADLLGLDEHTVARGRGELLSRDIQKERIRREGGGRIKVEKKHPK